MQSENLNYMHLFLMNLDACNSRKDWAADRGLFTRAIALYMYMHSNHKQCHLVGNRKQAESVKLTPHFTQPHIYVCISIYI